MKAFADFFSDNKRIVPVIALPELDMALPLADLLAENGFTVLEITLRTRCGLDAIHLLAKERPALITGAGTVKNLQQLQQVREAGARFIVSPGLDLDMVTQAERNQVPLVPGVMSATEVMQAENAGITTVKLFPANLAGGTAFIDAMKPVFPALQFFPTGGISETTAVNFLQRDNVICVGGSWLSPANLLQQRDWPTLRAIAARC